MNVIDMRDLVDLIEIMEYSVLMEERGRFDFLVKTYGSRLVALLDEQTLPIQIDQNDNPEEIAKKIVRYVSSFDPTTKGLNTQWLITRLVKKEMRFEDLEASKEYLVRFEDMKHHRQLTGRDADINSYKSLADLRKALGDTEQAIISATDAEERKMLKQSDVRIDNNRLRILIPKTQAAACYFGRNTEWCTAWGDHLALGLQSQGRHPKRENHYASYTQSDDLYIIEIKTNPVQLFQYHSATTQFADSTDRMLQPDAVAKLLTLYPEILKVIGEAKFVRSHLKTLGPRFFSPEVLKNLSPNELADSVRTKEDFEHLPEEVREDSDFIWLIIYQRPKLALNAIPQRYITPEIVDKLRTWSISGYHDRHDEKWLFFTRVPIKEWTEIAVEVNGENGNVTYEQLAQLEHATPQITNAIINGTASLKPERLADYPPGYIKQHSTDLIHLLMLYPQAMQYLKPQDMTDGVLITLATELQGLSDFEKHFGFLPPDRLTPAIVDAFNSTRRDYNKISYDEVQDRIEKYWISDFIGGLEYTNLRRHIQLPIRFRDDVGFYEKAFSIITGDNRHYAKIDRNRRIDQFFNFVPPEYISSRILEEMAATIILPVSMDALIQNQYVRKLSPYKDRWTPKFIKTCITKKMLPLSVIPDDLITSDVAARIFAMQPEDNKAMVYRADDDSLVYEIKHPPVYQYNNLIHYIPTDRITEPVAYAAVLNRYARDDAKRFPKDVLTKRVYLAGTPYTFNLNEVPKSFRTDDLVVKAVTKDAYQLRFVRHPVEWLNKHLPSFAKMNKDWLAKVEHQDITQIKDGFIKITDLPHDDLEKNYKLFKAVTPRGVQRWFLMHGKKLISIMWITNNTLRLNNENPSKDLESIFLEIAQRFLKNVDIGILNKIGIYRNRDGEVSDSDVYQREQPKEVIEGIEWTKTPHLQGTLYTGWLNDKPILSFYYATSSGWGHTTRKVRQVDIKDVKTCRKHVTAIMAGMKKLTWGDLDNYTLADIGIGFDRDGSMWLAMDKFIGKVDKFTVYYSPSHKTISVYNPLRRVASSKLYKNGRDDTHTYLWYEKDADDKETVNKILKAMIAKVREQLAAKS